MTSASLPSVDGVLDAERVAATVDSIARVQERDGAIPWEPARHVDVWNHVEAAMALVVGGRLDAARRAYDWVLGLQRFDGSWPTAVVEGVVTDDAGDANFSAYLAVGVWHHWLVERDEAFVRRCWPAVRAGLDWVTALQLPFGGMPWQECWVDGAPSHVHEDGALLAGSSSIYQALRAGVAIAELLGRPQPGWELAGGRLGHAIRRHPGEFADKSTFAMDWYYPVLGGAVRGAEGRALLESRWDDFVVPGLGVRCVHTNPWVTGAESAELVMALDAVGEHDRALRLLGDLQHLRDDDGRYATGYVYDDGVRWPPEHTTFTAGAVVLAADALGARHGRATPGSGIMRGDSLAPPFPELSPHCCATTAG
ncbi:prenyltransferase [uncultured Nocardioides sp.]|uniref:prenyltransferase n=1 Tax=uncultured Nocardioides sp. TaxID=198441 RepID=UPI002615033C|nr:prenyltransferase [uncultured Nocardioides sp.]